MDAADPWEGTASTRPVIHARILAAILDAVAIGAVQRARLLDSEGLGLGDLVGAGASVPLASYLRLFDRLADALDRPTLGLDISTRMGVDLVGAVGYVFRHSATLDAAIAAFSQAIFSIQGVTTLSYERGPLPVVRYMIADDRLQPRRHDVEFSLGYVHTLIGQFLGEGYAPQEVYFEHPCVASRTRYEHVFGCPVYFEQPSNALVLRPEDHAARGRMHDPHLVAILSHYLQLTRPSGPEPESIARDVDLLLPGLIEAGDTSCRLAAARLGLSEESLRRRLKREGVSFRELLRSRRCAFAGRLLRETRLSVLEVAHRAGYTETASLTRAFVAETGMTPSKFRRR